MKALEKRWRQRPTLQIDCWLWRPGPPLVTRDCQLPRPPTHILLSFDSTLKTPLSTGYVPIEALCHPLTLALGNPVKRSRREPIIYGALLCSAPALEEFDLASDLPFLVDSGSDRNTMVDAVEELRVLRLDECYLSTSSFLFHRGLTHLRFFFLIHFGAMHLRLSDSQPGQPMWPALESMLSTLALVPKLQVLELYGVLPSGHSLSPDRSLSSLPSLKELRPGGTGQSILALLQSLNLSENVQVFATLPNTVTEDGPISRWLIKLRGRQGIVPDHNGHNLGVY